MRELKVFYPSFSHCRSGSFISCLAFRFPIYFPSSLSARDSNKNRTRSLTGGVRFSKKALLLDIFLKKLLTLTVGGEGCLLLTQVHSKKTVLGKNWTELSWCRKKKMQLLCLRGPEKVVTLTRTRTTLSFLWPAGLAAGKNKNTEEEGRGRQGGVKMRNVCRLFFFSRLFCVKSPPCEKASLRFAK